MVERALVLDGSAADDQEAALVASALAGELTQAELDPGVVVVRQLTLGPCQGCFRCWMRTPGACRMTDDGPELLRRVISSDLLVLVTRISFGGYSSTLKRALDRALPLVHPAFEGSRTEVRHRARYDRYPALIGLGLRSHEDRDAEAIFQALVEHNAHQLHCPAHASAVLIGPQQGTDLAPRLRALLAEVRS